MNGNKTYEINIDVDLYRKITNSLNNIMGDLNGTLSKSKINPFSGELLTYYNSLENNVSSKLESIIGEIEELGLKIDTSINTYQNIDEELRFGLDSIVDKIFEVGNGSGISIEFDGLSTYQERKEYLEKLIESYTTTLEELKKEYNNLYGNGILIEYHEQFQNWFTIVTSLGGVNNFNSGLGNIYNQNGNLDIDNLSIILNFYKENNLNVKLKNYIIDGKSWSDSGLSSFNDNELTDNENEFNFLYSIYDSFGISSNEYVENIFFDGYDSYNEENINTAESFLSQKMDFNVFGKLNETYTDCITKQADIINLQSAIYNYEQYQKLMPFEEARRNIDYLDYISKDYSNYDNDILNGNMYGGKYKDYLNYMDQSEVALYDYIYTKQGSDIAETYLFALTDTINQRKGLEKALNYVSNLNQNGLDAGDFFASGWEGFKDGNITFFNGICNFFTADGVVSAFNYEMLYKMQLLSSDEDMKQLLSSDEDMKQLLSSDEYKNYTNNLSDEAKKFLSYNYQINNSIGNMTIPMLVSFVPVVGTTLMWTSSTGNATEQAMQGGASKATAYLYGGLSGLSEVALERVMGGIPGLSDGASVGFKNIVNDMLGEAKEEGLQTWIDAGLRAAILGEEIDLSSVTGESLISAGMGAIVSGKMKLGMVGPSKIIDFGVRKATDGKYSDYNSYMLNENFNKESVLDVTDAFKNNPDLQNIPNFQSVMFDPESNLYKTTLDNGKTMFVKDLSSLNKVNSNATLKLKFNFNKIKDNIQNTTGAILTKVGEVGSILKGFVLNTAMAEEEVEDAAIVDLLSRLDVQNNDAIDVELFTNTSTWFPTSKILKKSMQNFVEHLSTISNDSAVKILSLISSPTIRSYYEKAFDERTPNSKNSTMLDTYRTHGLGHVIEVMNGCIDVYNSLCKIDSNLKSTRLLDNLLVSGIIHDTGMSRNYYFNPNVNEDGKINLHWNKSMTYDGIDIGDVTRSNHSSMSGLNALIMRDEINKFFPELDVVDTALTVFVHSKSNSGVASLTEESSWSKGIAIFDSLIRQYNVDNPDRPIKFRYGDGEYDNLIDYLIAKGDIVDEVGVTNIRYNAGKIKYYDPTTEEGKIGKLTKNSMTINGNVKLYSFSDDFMNRMGYNGLSIRLGDANTNNLVLGTNQYGKKIKIKEITSEMINVVDILTSVPLKEKQGYSDAIEIRAKDELGKMSLYELDGKDGAIAGNVYIIGEANQLYNVSTEVDGNNLVFCENISVVDSNLAPAATIFAAHERFGEMITSGDLLYGRKKFVINLKSDVSEHNLKLYKDYVDTIKNLALANGLSIELRIDGNKLN